MESLVMKYRKKPCVVEAFKMGVDPRPDWFTEAVTDGRVTTHLVNSLDKFKGPFEFKPTWCAIKTPEGLMKGSFGDYIIKGVKGEIYPCKPDIFELSYEPIKENELSENG
jgi:hypothetical protein